MRADMDAANDNNRKELIFACRESLYPMTESIPDLATQLLQLQERHRELDAEIAQLEMFPYQDQLHLRRLKKEKLRIKDLIERVRTMLIPDLDA